MADRPQLPAAPVIENWAQELGFQQIGITHVDLSAHESHVREWLAKGFHGEMGYMARNLDKRLHPERLEAETCAVISARMNYLAEGTEPLAGPAPARPSLPIPLRLGPRLPQGAAPPPGKAGLADQQGRPSPRRPVSRLHRQRPGAGEGAGRKRGARLDGQAQPADPSGRRQLVLHWRDLHQPAVAGDVKSRGRPLRRLPGVHEPLSHRRHRRRQDR